MKIWDVDGNGSVSAFGDGLIIIKYIIGLRGDDLLSGGIGVGATRTTAAAIEGYIEMNKMYFDINGDGIVDFLDGWLILKALIGLTGTNLTGDSIRPGGTRTTSEELIAYKDKMVAESP